jgi:peptidoglycan-associated lipoprotein
MKQNHWLVIVTVILMVLFLASCAPKKIESGAGGIQTVGEESYETGGYEGREGTGREEGTQDSGITERPISEREGMEDQRRSQELMEERARREALEDFVNKDIHFEFDSAKLTWEAQEILKQKADWLLAHPRTEVIIEGHCDERGTNAYNLALGERRAESVKQYLVELGIRPNRLSTISYGEEKPLDPGHNEEAWAKNRRAHFVILD